MRRRALVCIVLGLVAITPLLAPAVTPGQAGSGPRGTPAGWSDEINISDNPNIDYEPSLALNGETIHLVWHDAVPPSGPCHILYRKSINAGVTWTSIQTLATATPLDYPHIGVNGSNIHVVWGDGTGWDGIYYRNSTDDGTTWNPMRRMSPTDSNSGNPHVYVNNSNVHIAWHDWRSGIGGLNGQIFYRRSLDGGITFDNGQGVDEDRQITFSPSTIGAVNMAGLGSNISVVWYDERDGSFQTYWMISKDNGYTWEDGLGNVNVGRKISDTGNSADPAIAMNGLNISIVWYEETWPGPYYRLYYRNSTDMGVTWNPTQLIAGPWPALYAPDIEVNGNIIHITWVEDYGSHYPHNVIYMNSTDGGNTWNGKITLQSSPGISYGPSKIVTKNETLHIIWGERYADNSRELYYKRYPEFPTDSIPPLLYHNPITDANGRLRIPIFINITEIGAYGVDNVTLYFKNIGDASFSNASMMFINGTYWNGTWKAEIPKQNQAGLLPYYIYASDHSNNSNQTIEYQIDVYDWPWPNVTAISPINGANNVSIATPISISFSEPMNISSVEDSFSYSNGIADWTSADGSWSWDASNSVGTFTPFNPLQYNSKYFIRLNSSIAKEADGHLLDGNEDSEWSPPESWLPAKDMLNFGNYYFGSAALNGLIYAIGGNSGQSTVEVYNPGNDSWYTVSPMNIGRYLPTASACNGKLYAVGGAEYSSGPRLASIEEYDPVTDTWTLKASLQTARYGHAAAVFEDKIYILGGLGASGTIASVEVYDTTLNITYEETNLTVARRYSGAVTYAGNIYIVGGVLSGTGPISTVESYNLITKQWTPLSDLHSNRMSLQLNVLNDRLYAMGGEGYIPASNERYNPITNEWTNAADMPRARTMFGSGVVNGKIYTFGGRLGPNYYSHDVYTPDDDFYSSFTTGGPSQMNITLSQGWNLISLSLGQSDESIGQVLSSIAGKWDCVQAYNASDSSDHWKTYETFRPGQLNDLTALNHKVGFWINITQPGVILTVSGYVPTSTSIPLYAGWNLVGYPSLNTETVGNALWGTGADKVEIFDPTDPYRTKEVGPTYVMKPGEGYWVHVVSDTVWFVGW